MKIRCKSWGSLNGTQFILPWFPTKNNICENICNTVLIPKIIALPVPVGVKLNIGNRMLVLKVASKPKLQKQQQQIIFHFQLAVAKMTYWTASFTPWLLLHSGTKLQKYTRN